MTEVLFANTSQSTLDLSKATREDYREALHQSWALYENLFSVLQEQAYFVRADPLRHPLIFYYAHTAVFLVNKLILMKLLPKRIDPKLESICAIGVDEMSWDDLNETHYDWPTVATVTQYREEVLSLANKVMDELPEPNGQIGWDSPWWIFSMSIEHERIHLETSSVLIRQLPVELLCAAKFSCWPNGPSDGAAPDNFMVSIPGGKVKLVKKAEGVQSNFGWDVEYGSQTAEVAPFKVAKYLTSNSEFLTFVDAGGYHTRQFWTEEGWKWRCFAKVSMPRFWRRTEEGDWRLRTMVREIDMPWNWPVEVNYHEAKAFCSWRGGNTRLPTEEEWYHLYDSNIHPKAVNASCTPPNVLPASVSANIELRQYASPCAVDQHQQGELFDITGNVWQWMETPILGWKGFTVHPAYDDFSVPTFDTKHNLIKGGSWISCGNLSTREARYAFRRHFYQHAGFRVVDSDVVIEELKDENGTNVFYELDHVVSQYIHFQYGPEYLGVRNYAAQCAGICLDAMKGKPKRKALDVGCSTGATSFLLAEEFDHVTGLDLSARFIKVAVQMRDEGFIRYRVQQEGDIYDYCEATRKGELVSPDTLHFAQGDACNLDVMKYSGYDLIFAGNLLDRLHDPLMFLQTIHEHMNTGGLLVITCPFTWLELHTAKEKWLGGFKENGENFTSLDGLTRALEANFRLTTAPFDVEFVLREHKRKFQHTFAMCTIWERL